MGEVEIHSKENNQESQEHLEANRKKFGDQCAKVLELLNRGIKLSVRDAMLKYQISSLPRRILDLKSNGIDIADEWVYVDEKRSHKVYFINFKTEAQKKEHVYKKGDKNSSDYSIALIKSTQPELFK